MKYEIGQKVETPFGIAEIVFLHDIPIKWARVKIPNNHEWLYSFNVDDLKPYKTPHERLIEMGYELNDTQDYLLYYDGNRLTISIHKKTKVWVAYLGVDGLVEVGLKLTKIMADYLEWLEEER